MIAVKKSRPELGAKAINRAIAADEWTIRVGAADLMVQAVGTTAALPIARQLTADKELAVRLAAARVLAHGGDPEAVKHVFAAALETPAQGVQAAADLAALGDASGAHALSMFVRDPRRPPISVRRPRRRIAPRTK